VPVGAAVALAVPFALARSSRQRERIDLAVAVTATLGVAYLIAGCIGVAFFGVLFFLALFLQKVWGYSPAARRGPGYDPAGWRSASADTPARYMVTPRS
jgi:hypothetical protein